MELQTIAALDAVVDAPLVAGAIGIGEHQPMQDGEEDGAPDGKLETAIGKQLLQHLATSCVAPQALEQQWRADALFPDEHGASPHFSNRRASWRGLGCVAHAL